MARCNLTDYQVYFPNAHTRVKHWSRGRVTARRMIRLHELSKIHDLRNLRRWARRFNFEELLTEGVDLFKNFNKRHELLRDNLSERLELD